MQVVKELAHLKGLSHTHMIILPRATSFSIKIELTT